jgi:hypothetical protein
MAAGADNAERLVVLCQEFERTSYTDNQGITHWRGVGASECVGFFWAFAEMEMVVAPKEFSGCTGLISDSQFIKIFLFSMQRHPERLNQPASLAALMAVNEAWPQCSQPATVNQLR